MFRVGLNSPATTVRLEEQPTTIIETIAIITSVEWVMEDRGSNEVRECIVPVTFLEKEWVTSLSITS